MSAVQADDLGELPVWDLGALYAGIDDPKFAADFSGAEQAAHDFAATYQGKLAGLDGAAFGAAISAYEAIEEQLGRILSYASLVYVTNMDDAGLAGFHADAQARASEIASVLVFFTLEINRLDDAHLAVLHKHPATARYQPWIEDLRIYRPHELSDELEKLLVEKSVTGRAAWSRLFDETVAGLRFSVRGKELTEEQTLHLLSEPDAALRADAASALSEVFARNIKLFALITNTLAKDKEVEDRWRHTNGQ